MKKIYLDYAAATPISGKVLADMKPYLIDKFYNPSANYLDATYVRSDIDNARNIVANILGSKPVEIIFTAGGTEANNLAIFGIAEKYPNHHMVYTSLEHDSIIEPMKFIASKTMKTSEINPKNNGIIDVDKIIDSINNETVLVSVMYANNEIGTIQPIRELSYAIKKIKSERKKNNINTPLYLHSDACQASNYLDLHVNRLGVDLMTLNGGKIYGPKQSGVLYVSSNVDIAPIIHGGGQERGFRSGTENVASIIGFASALEQAQQLKHKEVKRLQKIQHDFINNLTNKNISINGTINNRLPNNIHITIKDQDNERLIFKLDELGIMVASGSACSASNDEPSHVLRAIGLNDTEARSSIRITMGRGTRNSDMNKLHKEITKLFE